MDYGRLFLFMAVATAVMAIGTHLWCWVYSVVFRATLYWRIERLHKQFEIWDAEEKEIERRRAIAPRYMTWEQAMADFRGGVPLDDILDRLDGKFPPKAADIQFAGPSTPPMTPKELENAVSGPVLASVLGIMAILACIYGIGLKPEGVEILIKNLREKHNQPKPSAGGGA